MANAIAFGLGADLNPLGGDMRRAEQMIAGAGKRMRNLIVGLGIGAAIYKGADAVRKGFDMGGEISDLAARTGLAVRDVVLLGGAMKDAGVDASNLGQIVNLMQRNLGEKKGQEAIEGIGLSIEDVLKMAPADQFFAIGKAIGRIEDPAKRAQGAMDIFGRSGGALVTLFTDPAFGNVGPSIKARAEFLQRNAQQFDASSDALGRLQNVTENFFLGAGESLAAPIEKAANYLEAIDLIGKGQAFGQFLADGAAFVVQGFQDAGDWAAVVGGVIAGGAADAGNFLIDAAMRYGDILVAGWEAASTISTQVGVMFTNALEQGWIRLSSGFQRAGIELQSVVEFAFQKGIEFFDGAFHGLVNTIQAGLEFAIQKGLEGLSKIPGLNKALGLEGFQAQSFDEIKARAAASNVGDGFAAQSLGDIRQRNLDAVGPGNDNRMRELDASTVKAAERIGQAVSTLGSSVGGAVSRPSRDSIGANMIKERTAALQDELVNRMAARMSGNQEVAATGTPGVKTKYGLERLAGFSTTATALGSGGLASVGGIGAIGGLGGGASGLIRRGDAARKRAAAAEAKKEADKAKTPEGTNELLKETNQLLRDGLA